MCPMVLSFRVSISSSCVIFSDCKSIALSSSSIVLLFKSTISSRIAIVFMCDLIARSFVSMMPSRSLIEQPPRLRCQYRCKKMEPHLQSCLQTDQIGCYAFVLELKGHAVRSRHTGLDVTSHPLPETPDRS